jgi:hypothetical protein
LYPKACIDAAAEAFKDYLAVAMRSTDSDVTTIEVTVTSHPDEGSRVRREFMNYLLDLAIQKRLA